MLFKQEVTQGVVTPYKSLRFTFSLINPLAAFSRVFKPKLYFNPGSEAREAREAREASLCRKYIFYIYTGWSLYSTSCKPKGKSSDLFLKVYDKLSNNPCFVVNNLLQQYPNPDLANLDYKLIYPILCNQTSWHRPLQHRRTASSYEGAGVIRKKIGVSVRGIKTYSTNAITIDPLMLDFFTSQIQEYSEETTPSG